jgi:ABC-2 type transport system permease protein
MPERGRVVRTLRAEWSKLRSVPSTAWLLLAGVASTIAFGLLVCSAVDAGGASPGCVPASPAAGTRIWSSTAWAGRTSARSRSSPWVGVLVATSEYAKGMVRTTFAAMPWRSGVVLARAAVVVGSVVVAGLIAGTGSFLLGQPILHGNGFIPAQGYPVISIADPAAARAIVGTAVYLGVIALLGFAVGLITRRAGSAIALVLAVLYGPAIVSLMLAEPIRGTLQRLSPMMAGLAVQRTVERADSVPIGQLAGLAVAVTWALVAVLVAVLLVRRRDA